MKGALLRTHGEFTEEIKLRFREEEIAEFHREARRQGRTITWIVRQATRAGMPAVRKLPDGAGR